jgi:uncharacterized protein (TIGR01319 family)
LPELVLCVDVGSTFTKAVLVDVAVGRVLGTAQHPTTLTDVMTGVAAVREELAASGGELGFGSEDVLAAEILACSSAGGGLRLAVVGHERLVTAEAGQRVALSAGGRVVHLSSGLLTPDGVQALRGSRPDLIVLTGGTDGGNSDVIIHNARRIGIARIPAPVVLAGNRDAADAAAAELRSRGRSVTVTDNVLPSIGVLNPGPAREAIRAAFLQHVIGGKGLSRSASRINGKTFRQLVLAPTPDAMLTGVEALADGRGLLLIDVGGATTDVYSVLPKDQGRAEEGGPETGIGQAAAGDWLSARTVEGDLGVRSGALGVVAAALAEGLIEDEEAGRLRQYIANRLENAGLMKDARASGEGGGARVAEKTQPARGVGVGEDVDRRDGREDQQSDQRLAHLAVVTALRRHGRPSHPGALPRPLREVGLVVGSGGVLRHATQPQRAGALNCALTDHPGGWAVPEGAALAVDVGYTVFAAGLLHGRARSEAVRRLAAAGLEWLSGVQR